VPQLPTPLLIYYLLISLPDLSLDYVHAGSAMVRLLLERSVATNTIKNYLSQWEFWLLFLRQHYPPLAANVFMEGVEESTMTLVVAHYVGHLFQEGMRGKAIIARVTAVRQIYLFNCMNVAPFDHPILKQAKLGAAPSLEERKNLLKKKSVEAKLPIPFEFVLQMRMKFHTYQSSGEALVRRGIYLACALCFDTGCRISNVTHKPSSTSNDHCLRGSEVIMVCDGVKFRAGEAFRKHFKSTLRSDPRRVSQVEITYLTHKASGRTLVVPSANVIQRRNAEESQLVDDLVCWVIDSGVNEKDEFLSRYYRGRNRCLLSKDVLMGMKELSQELGIPQVHLGTHGCRKGFATSSVAHNETKKRAGWSVMSRVMEESYVTPINASGGFSLDHDVYCLNDLVRLSQQPLGDGGGSGC
jgi:hypothetical protein